MWWKRLEYAADFWLICRRALKSQSRRWRIFVLHYIEQKPWFECAGKVGLDRGNFFHEAYATEQTLGRALIQTRPYALYPVGDYFSRRGGPTNDDLVQAWLAGAGRRRSAAHPGG